MGGKMPQPSRDKRTGVWEYRKTVPNDLRPFIGKANIIRSLGTKDLSAAKPKFAKISQEIEECFANLRRGVISLSEREAAYHAGEIYRALVEPYKDNPSLSPEINGNLAMDRWFAGEGETQMIFVQGERSRVFLEQIRKRWNAKEIESYLLRKGLRLDQRSAELLNKQVLKAAYQGRKYLRRLADGDWSDDPDAGRFPTLPPAARVGKQTHSTDFGTDENPLLSTARAAWIKEKDRADGSGWKSKSARDYKLWSSRFIEVCGNRPISSYRKADAKKFKSVLMSIPPNFTQKKGFAGMTFVDAAAKAEREKLPPISPTNVNKIIGFVQAMFNHVTAHEDALTTNPFDGIAVTVKDKARLQRTPFSLDELKAIFKAPLFTGCKSSKSWLTRGDHIPNKEGIYWLPLIGLFTGARSGEIIQLMIADIRKEDGILYYDIKYDEENDDPSEEAKHLKSDAAYRAIPVHPLLLKLGFEEFVERRRKTGTRLFPEFPADAEGHYSTRYAARFKRFLESLNIKRKRNSFHSFRHCFEDACKNSKIPLDLINSLQGHAGQGMAARYGNGLIHLRVLSSEIERLEYIGLNLDHLLTNPRPGTVDR